MKHAKVLAVLAVLLVGMAEVPAQKLGDVAVKEMTIRGETVRKKMRFQSIEEYDRHGHIVKERLCNGQVNTYEYDVHGNLTKKSISDSDEFHEYRYDSKGRMVYEKKLSYNKYTNQYGTPSEFFYEYDARGNLVSWRMDRYVPTIYKYDANGFLIFKGEEVLEQGTRGSQMYYDNDAHGRKVHTKAIYSYSGTIVETWYKYDSAGNVIYSEDTDGNIDIYEYDASGFKTYHKSKYKDNWSEQWYGYLHGDILYEVCESATYNYMYWYEYEYKPDGSKIRYVYMMVR